MIPFKLQLLYYLVVLHLYSPARFQEQVDAAVMTLLQWEQSVLAPPPHRRQPAPIPVREEAQISADLLEV